MGASVASTLYSVAAGAYSVVGGAVNFLWAASGSGKAEGHQRNGRVGGGGQHGDPWSDEDGEAGHVPDLKSCSSREQWAVPAAKAAGSAEPGKAWLGPGEMQIGLNMGKDKGDGARRTSERGTSGSPVKALGSSIAKGAAASAALAKATPGGPYNDLQGGGSREQTLSLTNDNGSFGEAEVRVQLGPSPVSGTGASSFTLRPALDPVSFPLDPAADPPRGSAGGTVRGGPVRSVFNASAGVDGPASSTLREGLFSPRPQQTLPPVGPPFAVDRTSALEAAVRRAERAAAEERSVRAQNLALATIKSSVSKEVSLPRGILITAITTSAVIDE